MNELVLAPVERVLSFIGDSRAKIFDAHAIAGPELGERVVVTRSRSHPYFRASQFFYDGRFDERVARWLWEMRFLRETARGNGAFGRYDLEIYDGVARTAELEPAHATRTLVISCGGVDAWDAEERMHRRGEWFALDPAFEAEIGIHAPYRAQRERSVEDAQRDVRRILEPLAAGLQTLRACGFTRLYLLGLGPPSLEERVQWKPAGLRLRTRFLFDRVLEEISRENRVGYINVWQLAWSAEGRREVLYRDTDHHSTAIVPLIAERLLER